MLLTIDKTGDLKGVWEVRRGEAWGEKGEGMRAVEVRRNDRDIRTITARAVGQRNFYEVRQGFSPASLLKNPMILLAIVALGMTFGLPYLIENMDPETRAEFEQAQKQGGLASLVSGGSTDKKPAPNPANFDLAGWMAGQQAKGSEPEARGTGSDVRSGGARRRG